VIVYTINSYILQQNIPNAQLIPGNVPDQSCTPE
jgi:hypothetical protein